MVEELNIETLLTESAEISETEKTHLAQLANQFPWSEPIQQAWLKALYQTKDPRFKNELSRVAFISSDRAELYKLIYGRALQLTIDKVEKELEEFEKGTFKPEWQKAEKATYSSNDAEITSEELAKEEPLEETAPVEADVPEITVGTDIIPELAEQIKRTAADAIISKEVLEDINDKKALEETSSGEKEEEPSHISSDEFITWLISKASSVEYPSFEKQNYKKPKSGVSVEKLINNFITKDPKITPGKSREYGLEDLAKESLVDNEEFVTETLAEIYASQGNNAKAKRAFELLSLKYPEKSIYFAARIKKLGKKK